MKKIIIIASVVWVVGLILSVLFFTDILNPSVTVEEEQKEEQIFMERNPTVEQFNQGLGMHDMDISNILGQWTSDRNTKSILTLKEDFTYVDELWLGEGTYKIQGDYILLTEDISDIENPTENIIPRQRVLRYVNNEDGEFLYFSMEEHETWFTRATEEDIAVVQENIEKRNQADAEFAYSMTQEAAIESAKNQLIGFLWYTETATVEFTPDKMIISDSETKIEYEYKLDLSTIDMKGNNPVDIHVDWELTKNGVPVETNDLLISAGAMEVYVEFTMDGITYKIPRMENKKANAEELIASCQW